MHVVPCTYTTYIQLLFNFYLTLPWALNINQIKIIYKNEKNVENNIYFIIFI